MRRVLLALIAALAGMVALPPTAAAAPLPDEPYSFRLCLPQWEPGTVGPPIRFWICVPIYAEPRELPPDWPDPPCVCPFAVDLGVHAVLPASHANAIMSQLRVGFSYLGQAELTSDPRLRDTAMNAFTTSAGMLGGLRLPPARGGFLDERGGMFVPAPHPGPQQAADHLRNGLTMLQQWLGNQNPELWDLIFPQFRSAYELMVLYS